MMLITHTQLFFTLPTDVVDAVVEDTIGALIGGVVWAYASLKVS
jgi:hypothetical protein